MTYFKFNVFFKIFPVSLVGAECEGSVNDFVNKDSIPSSFVLKLNTININLLIINVASQNYKLR